MEWSRNDLHEQKETGVRSNASEHVTLVEVLELTSTFEEFTAAIQAAARRLEAEGIQELVTLQFYATPGSAEVGALLTFADRSRIMEHIDMITEWEEFERFFSTVKPIDMRVYGKLSAEAEAWVRQFGDILSKKFEYHVAGFVR
jgi:D-mannonate dehydratase